MANPGCHRGNSNQENNNHDLAAGLVNTRKKLQHTSYEVSEFGYTIGYTTKSGED